MRTKGKKLLGILLSLVLVVGMLPAWSMTVHADDKPAVKYLDENGDVKYCTDYTVVTQDMGTTWNAGWYYVKENVEFNSQIEADNDVHIILGDNTTLFLNNTNGDDSSTFFRKKLSVYAQSTDMNMGTLDATSQSTAIYAKSTITIAGGNIIANGGGSYRYGIICFDSDIIINGGHIIATSNLGDAIHAGKNVFINNGNVEASSSGDDSLGISAFSSNIEINGGNVIATGEKQALRTPSGTVKNNIPGTGWTNKEGTAGMAFIPTSPTGRDLSSYKKVQFPAVKANVKTPPTAKTLSFTGQAQELINAGVAENGTMQYGLSKNENTEPTTWSESIPTGIEAGTYYVWYYAKGITTGFDSAKDKVEVTIKEQDKPTPNKALEGDGQTVSHGTPARFRFDVDYNEFQDRGAVYVDGNPVDPKHFNAEPGSTVITLKDEFIDSLSEGEHTVTITLAGVSVGDATFTVTKAAPTDNKSPATGDSISNILLLFLISFIGLTGIELYTKKKDLFK